MASADFLTFVVTMFRRLIYLLHLHLEIRAVLDFILLWKLVRFKYALYAISVRQTEALPQASFRLHLTVDALALS